jgi:hypothetical protein
MPAWKALQGRITLFPTALAGGSTHANEFYKQIWGAEPEYFQKPSPAAGAFAASLAQGQKNGLVVSCSVQQVRIDLQLAPPASSGPALSLITDASLFHKMLADIIAGVRNLTINASRVALFSQFAIIADNFTDANKLILSILPKRFDLDLVAEQDFVLQFNEPRRDQGFDMNFVTKWSVERVQQLSLQIGGGLSQLVSENFLTSVSFDHNNVPKGQLSVDQMGRVLDIALEGISKGLGELRVDVEGF